MAEANIIKQDNPEVERIAAQWARAKANAEMWTTDILIFFLAILVIILALVIQGIAIEIAASVAVFSLSVGWFAGWRQGRHFYEYYYQDKLQSLNNIKSTNKEQIEESLEYMVQRVLRERWQK